MRPTRAILGSTVALSLLVGSPVAASLLFAAPAYASLASDTFKDVPNGHWAEKGVEELAIKRDMMRGYPDGTFRGDQPFTRLEFALSIKELVREIEKIANTSLRPDTPCTNTFADVSGNDRESVMEMANDYCLFQGVPGVTPDRFTPDQQISRYEVAAVIDNLMKLAEKKDVVRPREVTKHYAFTDVNSGDWAAPDVGEVSDRYGVMIGFPDNTFRGKDQLSRYQYAMAGYQTVPLIRELITQTTQRKQAESELKEMSPYMQGQTPLHLEVRTGQSQGLANNSTLGSLALRYVAYPSWAVITDLRGQLNSGLFSGGNNGLLLDAAVGTGPKLPILGPVHLLPYVGVRAIGDFAGPSSYFVGPGLGLGAYWRFTPRFGLLANVRDHYMIPTSTAGASQFLFNSDLELEYFLSPKVALTLGAGYFQTPSGYQAGPAAPGNASAIEFKFGTTFGW